MLYLAANGPAPTTAAQAVVTTGTSIKTLLQIKPLTGINLRLWEVGISFDGSAAATPGKCEFLETDVAATVTAYASGDICKLTNPAGPAADSGLISLGTSASGYTSTAEGTITAVRQLAGPILLPPTGPFALQIPLGGMPVVQAGKFFRIRVTFGAAINAYCYAIFGPED